MTFLAQFEEQTMTRPTFDASDNFFHAIDHFVGMPNRNAGSNEKDENFRIHLAKGLELMAEGLNAMSIGLRATYLLLEEVNRTIKRPKPDSRWG